MLGVIFVAFKLSLSQSMLLIQGLGALTGGFILLRRPMLGLLLLVASISLFPIGVSTGTLTQLNLTVLLIPALSGLWLFSMVAGDHRGRLNVPPSVLAALGLAVAALFAFILGQLPWYPLTPAPITAQLGGLAVFVLSAAVFILVANQVQESLWLERLTWLCMGLTTLQIIVNLMPNRIPLKPYFNPLNSSLLLTWVIAISFSQALFNKRLAWYWRGLLVVAVAVSFFLTFVRLRSWASGWMPGMVAIMVIVFSWRPRTGLILGLLGAIFGVLYIENIFGVVILQDNLYSVDTRLAAWSILLELVEVNPLLGLGPANYYWYTPLFSILGFNVQFNSHNQYIDIIAQAGLIGMAFFTWWAVDLAKVGWQLRNKVKPGFEQAYVFAAIGGLAGTVFAGMLGDWVLPFVYNVGLDGFRGSSVAWIFLGGMIALDRIVRRRDAEAAQEGAASSE
jgi:hypothetical protein